MTNIAYIESVIVFHKFAALTRKVPLPLNFICVYFYSIVEFNSKRAGLCFHCEPACKQQHYRTSVSQSTFPSYAVPSVLQSLQKWELPALAFGEQVM